MDIFNNDAFSLVSLTNAVNEMPFVPSRIRSMGLFRPRPVMTTYIEIEKKGTSLSLVQTSQRGAPPSQRNRDKRDIRNLRIPRIAREAVVYADQVQNVRAFGTESEVEMVQQVLNQEIGIVRSEVDMTEENLMLGAITGTIVDADGSTIYNLFTEFGVTPVSAFSFALATSTTDVRGVCANVYRTMARELKAGGMPFKVRAFCSDTFFDDLISHPNVKDAYQRYQAGAALRDSYAWDTFDFGGISFENYRGTDDGSSITIADGDARFFAEGVPGLFDIAYAPADTTETVNTLGLPRYVIPGVDPSGKNRFMSAEVQANPLPYCTRPRTLLRGTAA